MDLTVIREGIVVCETIFEGSVEQPVDLDFVLPDYCPDITRVLKCSILPQINAKQILGDRLNVEGTALIRLCYVGQSGGVRLYENAVPFSSSFNLKSSPEDCLSDVSANVEYVNCRATSQRRLDIHAALLLSARLVSKSRTEIASGLEGDSIETKKKLLSYDSVASAVQQHFAVTETVEIGRDKARPKQIFRTEAHLVFSDYKAIVNKVILKAEVVFKVVYLTDDSPERVERMEYSLPVSQILDVPGLDESVRCSVRLDILSSHIAMDTDVLDDAGRFKAELKAVATLYAFERTEVPVLLDAYSTRGELTVGFADKPLPSFVQTHNENHICKGNLSIRDTGIDEVADIWFECQKGMSSLCADGRLTVSGKINVCLLALDSEGEYLYLERSADYEYIKKLAVDNDLLCKDLGAVPLSIGYRMNTSGELEIQAELRICASLYAQQQVRCIDAAALEENETDRSTLPGLVVYFADRGEELWDIARAHATCVRAIREENNLTGDVMENRDMLILPV